MTDTSIREELRRAAREKYPWDSLPFVEAEVVMALINLGEPWRLIKTDHEQTRWFFLLVAEAL